MRRVFTSIVLAVVAVTVLSFAPFAWAENVQGKIKAVDRAGQQVMLEDGTTLMIPASMKIDRQALQPGADVKASYEVKGSQKVVTAIEVQPAK